MLHPEIAVSAAARIIVTDLFMIVSLHVVVS